MTSSDGRPSFSDFGGTVAFVTGAASGIGRTTALRFAAAGAAVSVVDLDGDGAERTAREITDNGGRALSLACDVASEEQVEAAVGRTARELGGLHAAFNNAGIEQPAGPLDEIAPGDFERLVSINLTGVYYCMKHELAQMLETGGTIVNTSSGAGVKGIAGVSAYCATKFGVIGLTKAAALDYAARGVRINAVCPGMIETPMYDRYSGGTPEGRARVIEQEPIGRMGTPEEIADTVLWLSSSASSFVIGHAVVVDGGQTV